MTRILKPMLPQMVVFFMKQWVSKGIPASHIKLDMDHCMQMVTGQRTFHRWSPWCPKAVPPYLKQTKSWEWSVSSRNVRLGTPYFRPESCSTTVQHSEEPACRVYSSVLNLNLLDPKHGNSLGSTNFTAIWIAMDRRIHDNEVYRCSWTYRSYVVVGIDTTNPD